MRNIPGISESRNKAGWSHAYLGEVARIDRNTILPNQIHGHEFYVGLENITSDGEFQGVTTASKTDLKSNKFAFSEEHILFGKLRPYLAKIVAPDFRGSSRRSWDQGDLRVHH